MPELRIEYKGRVVFDGEVSSMEWKEDENSLTAKARIGPVQPALASIAEALARAGQQRKTTTQALAPEPVEIDLSHHANGQQIASGG